MIRKASIEDINIINELGIKYNSNFLNTYHIDSYLKNFNYIIYVNEENVINSFMIVYKNYDFYEIEAIYVDENVRGKGIATMLIITFFSTLNKGDEVLLEVAVNNEIAINLYKKFGFEVINTRKKYYSGTDALVMKKVN